MRMRKWIKAFYHRHQGIWHVTCYVCGADWVVEPAALAYDDVFFIVDMAHGHLSGHNRGAIRP